MTRLDTALIFGAGLGIRMRPLTDDRAKAEVALFGKRLIDHCLDRCAAAGIGKAVVNVHAHADRLIRHLGTRAAPPEILISDERDQLLETGGGLRKALPLLGTGPVFTINVDAFWLNGPGDALRHMADRWDGQAMDALLMIIPSARALGYDGRGDFEMDPWGRLQFRDPRHVSAYVHGGVQIIDPGLVDGVADPVFSINRIWRGLAERGRLYGLLHDGPWAHIGTPEAREEAEARLRHLLL